MDGDITITLTRAEAEHLVELLDIAVKAGGIRNARAALPIADKVADALIEPYDVEQQE